MEDKIKELIKLVEQLEKLMIRISRMGFNPNQTHYIEGGAKAPTFYQ